MEEKLASWDWESVKIELTQGQAHADELNQQLNNPTSVVSREACGFLLEKVLESYDNALALLSSSSPYSDEDSSPKSGRIEKMMFKDDHKQACVSKKRKTGPAKWRDQMRVCSGTESDGYYWRKYGQKKILNAAHPRAYYRCTHRHTQGCLATKQVQRQEDDAQNFQVVYIRKHTCIQETLKQNPDPQKIEEHSPVSSPNTMVINHHIDETEDDDSFQFFAFQATPNEPKDLDIELFSGRDGFIGTNDSSPFIGPETPESYFSTSHCQLNYFSIGLQSSESDFAEIISNPTSFMFGDIDTQFLNASDTFW